MQDVILLVSTSAIFIFGYFLMKKLDVFLENNWNEQETALTYSENSLRIGFSNPLMAGGLADAFETDVALGLQELDHIVAAALDRLHVLSGLAGNAELIVVPNQSMQTLQTPEKDTLFLPQQLVHQKRIVRSACGPVFDGQHDLAAKETVGLVVQGGQRTVSEAEEPDIELALVTLDALALHVHFALGRDDGFDIVGLGQGAQIHIIVHHQEFVLQVRTAEPVALHLLDAGGIHAVAQQGAHDKTDTAFALAALADEHEHLLSLGSRQQAVP